MKRFHLYLDDSARCQINAIITEGLRYDVNLSDSQAARLALKLVDVHQLTAADFLAMKTRRSPGTTIEIK